MPAVPVSGPIGRIIRCCVSICLRIRLCVHFCFLRLFWQRKRGRGRAEKLHADIGIKKVDIDRIRADRSFAARAAHRQRKPSVCRCPFDCGSFAVHAENALAVCVQFKIGQTAVDLADWLPVAAVDADLLAGKSSDPRGRPCFALTGAEGQEQYSSN